MAVELKVPEVGESITDVVIGRWLKGPGDTVAKDDPLVEIETDKITLELPAPADGQVTEKKLEQGSEAKVGDTIGMFEEGGGEQAAEKTESKSDTAGQAEAQQAAEEAEGGAETRTKTKPEKQATTKAQQASESKPQAGGRSGGGDGDARIMPAARRLIDQHQLNPADIPASGPGGRLLKEDVQRFIAGRPAGAPQPDEGEDQAAPKPAGSLEEVVPMTPLRRRIAENLVNVQRDAALLTTFNEVDMSAVMKLRKQYRDSFEKQHGVRLGFMSFFVKASIDALKQFPAVNAEVRGTDIVYKNHYDIGIAVGTGKGLVVPVLRDADRMSFAEIELAINDYVKRISENKIKLEELQGGTFTITNGGVFGSMLSTPIINPPQSGVLGMHSITERAMVVEGQIVARPMMYLALSYDHRLVDGREAVSFLVRIKQSIEDPTRMLMEV